MQSCWRVFLCLVGWVGVVPSITVGQSLEGIQANREGVSAIKDERPNQALRAFSEAVNLDPSRIEYRLNFAYSLAANENIEQAEQEYLLAIEMASKQRRSEFQLAGWFNLGVLRSAKGDIAGALYAYQRALELEPNSKEIKTNIELLWQQQQGKGGGKGDPKKDPNEQQKDQQKDQGDQDQKPEDGTQDPKQDQQKKGPSPDELTPEMARKILEELKAQEQKVRAEHLNQAPKEKPRGKQW